MYQIIQLQPEEDIRTISAKIELAELAHLVLVVPRDCRALESNSGLQLLRRAADDLGTQIALVAHNDFARAHAAEFGFPVFSSITQAQRTHWQMQEIKRDGVLRVSASQTATQESKPFDVASTIREWRGAILLMALAMLLLCIAAFFFVPTAQVRIVPSSVALTTSTDVIIDSSIGQVTAETRSIPARRLNHEISGILQIKTTTTKNMPDARSIGTVTFTNLRSEETVVPPGIVVMTSAGVPIRFTTLTTATVPAGLNSRVDAQVQAIDPGPVGNVKALAINSVEGSMSLSVRVINTQPTTSGNVRAVKVVTADDKKKAQDQLEKILQAQAPAVLQSILKPNEFVPPDSVLVDSEELQFDHLVDEPADALNLKITANAFGLAVDRTDLESLVSLMLQNQMQPGYQLLPNGIKVDTAPGAKFQGIPLRQPIRAVGYTTPQIDPAKVASSLQGKSIDEAKQFLSTKLNLAQPPEISVAPTGWFRMPWFAFRIAVFVEPPKVTP
jgi:hypothetical protein